MYIDRLWCEQNIIDIHKYELGVCLCKYISRFKLPVWCTFSPFFGETQVQELVKMTDGVLSPGLGKCLVQRPILAANGNIWRQKISDSWLRISVPGSSSSWNSQLRTYWNHHWPLSASAAFNRAKAASWWSNRDATGMADWTNHFFEDIVRYMHVDIHKITLQDDMTFHHTTLH